MKKLERRAFLCLALVAVLLAGLVFFIVRIETNGADWATFYANTHIYANGKLSVGSVYDRNGKLLLKNTSKGMRYNSDELIRRANLHSSGDPAANIATGANVAFKSRMVGYNFVTGGYADITIIATGIMVSEAMQAAEELAAEHGIEARVIDMHTIKPLDAEAIVKAAEETGAIVTAEEHSVIGGLGSAVAEVVTTHCPVKMYMVGQQDTFGESGKPDELKKKYGMTKDDIVKGVLTLRK